MRSITLIFGGKPYPIAALTLRQARAWRLLLIAAAREISGQLFQPTNGHDDIFFNGLGAAFIAFPDKMRDLVFAYAPELHREEVLAEATDEEMAVAFSQLTKAALPFLPQLSLMAEIAN